MHLDTTILQSKTCLELIDFINEIMKVSEIHDLETNERIKVKHDEIRVTLKKALKRRKGRSILCK